MYLRHITDIVPLFFTDKHLTLGLFGSLVTLATLPLKIPLIASEVVRISRNIRNMVNQQCQMYYYCKDIKGDTVCGVVDNLLAFHVSCPGPFLSLIWS